MLRNPSAISQYPESPTCWQYSVSDFRGMEPSVTRWNSTTSRPTPDIALVACSTHWQTTATWGAQYQSWQRITRRVTRVFVERQEFRPIVPFGWEVSAHHKDCVLRKLGHQRRASSPSAGNKAVDAAMDIDLPPNWGSNRKSIPKPKPSDNFRDSAGPKLVTLIQAEVEIISWWTHPTIQAKKRQEQHSQRRPAERTSATHQKFADPSSIDNLTPTPNKDWALNMSTWQLTTCSSGLSWLFPLAVTAGIAPSTTWPLPKRKIE